MNQYEVNQRFMYSQWWFLWYECCDTWRPRDNRHRKTLCYLARWQGGP